MTKITAKRAIKGLKTAVDKRGRDYVIPAGGCRYVNQISDAPSCLVGQALADLGVPVTQIFSGTSANGASVGSGSFLSALESAGITLSPKAAIVFSAAQKVQDGAQPWGAALDYALAVYVSDE